MHDSKSSVLWGIFRVISHHASHLMPHLIDLRMRRGVDRRLAIMHQPNLSNRKEKRSHTTQTLPEEVEQEGVIDKETPSLFLYNSSENLNDKIVKERTMEDESCSVSQIQRLTKRNDHILPINAPALWHILESSYLPAKQHLSPARSEILSFLLSYGVSLGLSLIISLI